MTVQVAFRHWSRQVCRSTWVVVPILVGLFVGAACGSTKVNPERQVAGRGQIVLMPNLMGGRGGWCMMRLVDSASGTCPTFHMPIFEGPFSGPVIVELWSGGSSNETPVNEALILATSEVASVSFEGRAPVATHASPLLPDHLRGALIELHLASPSLRRRPPVIALNAMGKPITQMRTPAPPLEFSVPSRSWEGSQRVSKGVCGVVISNLRSLVFRGGRVMTAVRPHPDIRGREFVDCLSANYLLGNWPIEINILLDAARPGSAPGPLPAMRPMAGHTGVFDGPGIEGDMVARRIHGGWLLVAKGEDLGQRLSMLEHIRAKSLY